MPEGVLGYDVCGTSVSQCVSLPAIRKLGCVNVASPLWCCVSYEGVYTTKHEVLGEERKGGVKWFGKQPL